MFDTIGGGEILLIFLVILLLFGPKKIPELAQSLGKGLREFRKAQQEFQQNLSKVVNDEDMKSLSQSINEIREGMTQSVQQLTSQINQATTSPALPAAAPPTAAAENQPPAPPAAGTTSPEQHPAPPAA